MANDIIENINELENVIVEYVFIDRHKNTRSKTRIISPRYEITDTKKNNPQFSIDVMYIDGYISGLCELDNDIELVLLPRGIFNDPFSINTSKRKYLLCMCEVMTLEGLPHITNNRSKLFQTMKNINDKLLIENKNNTIEKTFPLFGVEQEYVILKNLKTDNDFSNDKNQNTFGCDDYKANATIGRNIAMEHMNKCLDAGVKICGINSDIGPLQWSFQLENCDPFMFCDNLWISRYILSRIAELHNITISYDPKTFGNYCTNTKINVIFSTYEMRQENGIVAINSAIEKMLTKEIETETDQQDKGINAINTILQILNEKAKKQNNDIDLNKCVHSKTNNKSTIEIPTNVKMAKSGYLIDKRHKSNSDPYLICSNIIDSVLS
jgi:glutamine synthetase